MYCSTCGALIPEGRRECVTCGSAVGGYVPPRDADAVDGASIFPPDLSRTPRPEIGPIGRPRAGLAAAPHHPTHTARTVCPRCDYEGQGIPYFNRGTHLAGLIIATVLTLPGAIGAGGILYYWLRHDHTICPRCGYGWGKHSVRALPARIDQPSPPAPPTEVAVGPAGDGVMRAWSYILIALGAIALGLGIVDFEPALLVIGAVFGGGGALLYRGANRVRQKRREALLASLQLHVLRLAGERQGRLTVSEVAAALSWPLRRAEKVLQSLDDGWRVNSVVTDDGLIVYEFRELLPRGDSEISAG